MNIALYFTLNCTARCAHCVTLAGPKVSRKMTLEEAKRIIEGVRRATSLSGVCFTGGENFIYAQELLALVRHCQELGLESEIISNGYWAKTPEKGAQFLRPFVEAGLKYVRISLDKYHQPFISPRTSRAAIEAVRLVGLPRSICCVVEQRRSDEVIGTSQLLRGLEERTSGISGWTPEMVEELLALDRARWNSELLELLSTYEIPLDECARIEDWYRPLKLDPSETSQSLARYLEDKILVFYQFVATEGRGRTLLDAVPLWPIDQMNESTCDSVGRSPSITPEGNIFPCCSSWVNFPAMRTGVHDGGNVPDLMRAVEADRIALFMNRHGPLALVRFLKERGHDLPDAYSHICHLCGTLLERYSRQELESHIEEFFTANPWRTILTQQGFCLDSNGPRDLESENKSVLEAGLRALL